MRVSAQDIPVEEPPPAELPVPDEQIKEVADAAQLFGKLQFDAALSKLKEATTKHPELPPAQLIMATWFARANQAGAVRAYLELTVKDLPNDPEAYLILGDINTGERRTTEAGLLYAKAAELVPGVTNEERKSRLGPRVESGLAAVAAARQDWATAQKHLEAWLKLDPKSDVAMRRLAVALFQQRDAKQALEQLKTAYEINPKTLHYGATMAQFYEQSGDHENAKTWMEFAMKAAPKALSTWLVAAQWSLQTGQLAEAEKEAATAMQLDRESIDAKILRGVIALFQRDYKSAEIYFESALLDSPRNFAAKNNLALALCEQSDEAKKRRALDYAVENARLFPKNAEAISTYGWVLYRAGNVKEADTVLSRLARSGRVSEDTAYFIARVAAESGRKDEAKAVLEPTLQSKRPFSKRQEAQTLLDELNR